MMEAVLKQGEPERVFFPKWLIVNVNVLRCHCFMLAFGCQLDLSSQKNKGSLIAGCCWRVFCESQTFSWSWMTSWHKLAMWFRWEIFGVSKLTDGWFSGEDSPFRNDPIFLVGTSIFYIFPYTKGNSSYQVTKSYFSEGWLNHQPVYYCGGSPNWGGWTIPGAQVSIGVLPPSTQQVRRKTPPSLSDSIWEFVGKILQN